MVAALLIGSLLTHAGISLSRRTFSRCATGENNI